MEKEEPRSTYIDRVLSFQKRMNPAYLFVGEQEINQSKQVLSQDPQKHTPAIVQRAQGVVDACVHPQTGKSIPALARMAGFVPINIPICGGMLLAAPTLPNLIGWQWLNQTYNAAFNFTHGNKAEQQPGKAKGFLEQNKNALMGYICASVVSVSLAVGSTQWLKHASFQSELLRRTLQMIVPYTAVAAAGVANVGLMRAKELVDGIPVFLRGELVGNSKQAAKQAILQTAISRIVLPIPILALPPPVLALCYTIPAIKASKQLRLLAELAVLVCGIWVGLPCAVGIFPQTSSMDVNKLEPDIREKAKRIMERQKDFVSTATTTVVTFNKGV